MGSRILGKAGRIRARCASRLFRPRIRRLWTGSNGYVKFSIPTKRRAQHDSNQKFYRDIVGWKYISHPNVLSFLGVSETLFKFCIISPWMPNGNITEYIKRRRRVNRLQLVSDPRNQQERSYLILPPKACASCLWSRISTFTEHRTR